MHIYSVPMSKQISLGIDGLTKGCISMVAWVGNQQIPRTRVQALGCRTPQLSLGHCPVLLPTPQGKRLNTAGVPTKPPVLVLHLIYASLWQ